MSEPSRADEDAVLLLGRDRELARVEQRLEHGVPAVIGLLAPVGMGKTALLTELEARGRLRGWRVARTDANGDFTVGSATTADEFCARIRELLQEPLDASGLETPRHALGSTTLSTSQAFVQQLARLRRALILIEVVNASPAFTSWFASDFVPVLRRANVPVIVVVAGLPGALDTMAKVLDDVIELGALDRPVVRAHFEAVASPIVPPVTSEELDVYVDAAVQHPVELQAFSRLLQALHPDRPTPAPGPLSSAEGRS